MTHAIFEREGVIIDCPIPGICEDTIIFKKFDRRVHDTLYDYFEPRKMDKVCELLVDGITSSFDRTTYDSIYHKTLMAECLHRSDVRPGIINILSTLRERKLPIVLVSHHSSAEALVHAEKYSHMMSYFEGKIFKNEYEASYINI